MGEARQRGHDRGRLFRWASRAGHDDRRSRPVLRWAYESAVAVETAAASRLHSRGAPPVDPGTVTLAVKTFERPAVLRRMLASVRKVYAGPIIVADDSRAGFVTEDPLVRVLRLPFDSGIGAGRNALLAAVQTEFVFMADDDMMLLPDFDLTRPLDYLRRNERVDLCGGRVIHLPLWRTADYSAAALFAYRGEPRERAGVLIDGLPVVYKAPNFYLARTERVRGLGYDDRLKRMDHKDFFTSAYGELLCVVDPEMVCLHAHSFFDPHYQSFRMDSSADAAYLGRKWGSHGDGHEPVDEAAPTAGQLAVLHHASLEAVARDLDIRIVHHGTPADVPVTISVPEPRLAAFLKTLRTLGWAGSGRRLAHRLWGELTVVADAPKNVVPAAFATINGFADNDAWPAPLDRPANGAAPAEGAIRWHPRAGWVDDGESVLGAALPLGPVRRLDFPGDLIWETVGPAGGTRDQVTTDVLAAFADPPPEAAGQIGDYLDTLVTEGLLQRLPAGDRFGA